MAERERFPRPWSADLEAHPRPWRVSPDEDRTVLDANGKAPMGLCGPLSRTLGREVLEFLVDYVNRTYPMVVADDWIESG